MKNLAYDPRLETILMVERFIETNNGKFSRFQVWQRLPRKAMYQTFCVILTYLEESRKISVDNNGKIFWAMKSHRPKPDRHGTEMIAA